VRYPGWKTDRKQLDEVEIIAKQWAIACREARSDLQEFVPEDQWMEVRYEDIVTAPTTWIRRICSFCGLRMDENLLGRAEQDIHADSLNRWEDVLDSAALEKAMPHMHDVLAMLGYPVE
jgi:hypothetical protein